MTNSRLAEIITDSIFELGAGDGGPTQRIQLMGGKWPHNEIDRGGMNKAALKDFILQVLQMENPEP